MEHNQSTVEVMAEWGSRMGLLNGDAVEQHSFEFNIVGENPSHWILDAGEGTKVREIAPGSMRGDVQISLSEKDLLSLSRRENTPQELFLLGRLSVKGDVSLALIFSALFLNPTHG